MPLQHGNNQSQEQPIQNHVLSILKINQASKILQSTFELPLILPTLKNQRNENLAVGNSNFT